MKEHFRKRQGALCDCPDYAKPGNQQSLKVYKASNGRSFFLFSFDYVGKKEVFTLQELVSYKH